MSKLCHVLLVSDERSIVAAMDFCIEMANQHHREKLILVPIDLNLV